MACGLSKDMLALADQIDSVNEAIDEKINNATAPIEDLLGDFEDTINGAVDAVEAKIKVAVPSLIDKVVPDNLQTDIENMARIALLGAIAIPQFLTELDRLKDKWGPILEGSGQDIDLNNIADLIRNGALDIDTLCKKIPNIDFPGGDQVNVMVKGIPVTFPNVDAVDIIRGAPIPEITKPEFSVDVGILKNAAKDRWINFDLPKLFKGPRG